MEKRDIVKELISRRQSHHGEEKFHFSEEAKGLLLGRNVKVRYPNGETASGPVTFVTASSCHGLFAIQINGEFCEIFENTEVKET